MRKLIVVLAFVFLTGCQVSEATALRVLHNEGLENIQLHGYALWGCSEEDEFRTSFTATRNVIVVDGTTRQVQVEGSICCGWFKDCTVRYR